MTKTRLRHFVFLLLAPLLIAPTLLVVAPAQAEEAFYCTSACAKADARNDAPAKADLLRGRFVNGPAAFKLRLKVRDLKRTGSFVLGAGLGGWGVNYRVVKTAKGYKVTSRTISEVQVYPAKPCTTARVAWNAKKNFIQARFPFACSGNSGDSIMNGVDFKAGRAKDRIGRVYYRP